MFTASGVEMKPVELSLIIPAFNESAIIAANVDELSVWLKNNLPDLSCEIVVVNDGSNDGMGELLESLKPLYPCLKVAHHKRNLGRGRGVRTGFKESKGNYVVADFICPTPEARSLFPADYIIWVDTIKEGRFDDTNKMFVKPNKFDFHVTTQDAKNWAPKIYKEIK